MEYELEGVTIMLTKNIDIMKAEIAAHIAADQVSQGYYWEDEKGCFIGCLTRSSDATKVTERFGIPVPLVKICEHIFERSSQADSVTFFRDVGDAIGSDGKDLSRIHWVFLRDALKAIPKQKGDIQEIIDPVIEGMELLAKGHPWSTDAARVAAHVAFTAYNAHTDVAAAAEAYTTHAAYAAAFAACDACTAARAASDAAQATVHAASRDVYASDPAAYAAEIERQRDSILALLAAA